MSIFLSLESVLLHNMPLHSYGTVIVTDLWLKLVILAFLLFQAFLLMFILIPLDERLESVPPQNDLGLLLVTKWLDKLLIAIVTLGCHGLPMILPRKQSIGVVRMEVVFLGK